jgi:LSD1 subclass zinc finger protein
MAVTLLCPNLKCRQVLQVPESVRGKQVRCSHCSTSLLVPAKAAAHDKPREPNAAEAPAKT